jgi:hypothetical protein
VQIRNMGTRQIYFQPRRIIRELRNLTSLSEIHGKVKLGLMLATEVYSTRSRSLPAPQTLL